MSTLTKTALTALLLSSALLPTAHASEGKCMALSNLAGNFGSHITSDDMTEAEWMGVINDPERKTSTNNVRVSKLVLQYVYMMHLDSVSARKLVYMKCKVGEYD